MMCLERLTEDVKNPDLNIAAKPMIKLSLSLLETGYVACVTKRIETEKDENDCVNKIKAHTNTCQDSGEISKSLASFTRTHLTTSFVPKLKNYHFIIINI